MDRVPTWLCADTAAAGSRLAACGSLRFLLFMETVIAIEG
ncbi:hypothetical protein RR42_s1952 [Cupriavidus basilensis]|uniref:Uncharacterized protein n=1 Tax=Cupriavidus basilensis TaxID=68895 RepID=A0A0C4YLU8_9BURK|nr:hypothetical protein RR42_s1952 [Cupriavidus basilensis]